MQCVLCTVTGKSFSLRNVLSVFGVAEVNIYDAETNPAAVIMKAANTTLPLGIPPPN